MPLTDDERVTVLYNYRDQLNGPAAELWIRILKKCEFVETTEDVEGACWIWQGGDSGKDAESKSGRGYGRISVYGVMSAVHRVTWTLIHGYLPRKAQIDHLCYERLCCNPKHLERVTHKENCRRRDARLKKIKESEEANYELQSNHRVNGRADLASLPRPQTGEDQRDLPD